MYEIAIISGKGGTGKTTITAAFAAISKEAILADCDVDAPDLHILFQPEIIEKWEFHGSKVASIDPERCIMCNLCAQNCRFDAAHPPTINPISCEGCGVCELVCPRNAIQMQDRLSGHIFSSKTRFGPMAHAMLIPGEGNSGKLVTEVRRLGVKLANAENREIVLIDGSPGIGCPVISTLTGIKLGVIVTEPTMSGIHDMERIVELMRRFRVKTAAIINKYDLNPENTEKLEEFCRENEITILGRIPFDPVATKSMVAAKTLPEFAADHQITKILQEMWERILQLVRE